jgi:hypothetical protein
MRYLEELYERVAGRDGVLHWNGAEIYDWYNGAAKVHS